MAKNIRTKKTAIQFFQHQSITSMNITAAAVIRLANASPEKRDEMLKETSDFKGIIKKAKELMEASPVDQEQNKKLDELIGACSFNEMPQRLPKEAFA